MSPKTYQRLTTSRLKSKFNLLYRTNGCLWLSNDHLLLVEARGYDESYRRFYFCDIQAVILMVVDRWWRGPLLMAGFGLALGMFGILMWTQSAGFNSDFTFFLKEIPTVLLAAVLLVWSLGDLAGGPTCRVVLHTSVQTQDLYPIKRLRKARKALGRLRVLVEAAQGAIPAMEVEMRMESFLHFKSRPLGSEANAAGPQQAT